MWTFFWVGFGAKVAVSDLALQELPRRGNLELGEIRSGFKVSEFTFSAYP